MTNNTTSLTATNYANYVVADSTSGWKAFEPTMTGLTYILDSSAAVWKSMVLCFKAGTSSTNWVDVLLLLLVQFQKMEAFQFCYILLHLVAA